jgi:hypothetical protein
LQDLRGAIGRTKMEQQALVKSLAVAKAAQREAAGRLEADSDELVRLRGEQAVGCAQLPRKGGCVGGGGGGAPRPPPTLTRSADRPTACSAAPQ